RARGGAGDTVRIVLLTVPPAEFKVSAVFKFGDAGKLAGATLAACEPTTAQRVLNKVGVWDEIDAAAKSGSSQTQLRDALTSKLQQVGAADRYESITQAALAKETADNVKQGLAFFNAFLLIFALVALFVGAFSLGVVLTCVSALSPARRAARAPPIAAIGDHVAAPTSGRRRYTAGGIVTALGVILLFVGLFAKVKSSDVPGGAGGLVGVAA